MEQADVCLRDAVPRYVALPRQDVLAAVQRRKQLAKGCTTASSACEDDEPAGVRRGTGQVTAMGGGGHARVTSLPTHLSHTPPVRWQTRSGTRHCLSQGKSSCWPAGTHTRSMSGARPQASNSAKPGAAAAGCWEQPWPPTPAPGGQAASTPPRRLPPPGLLGTGPAAGCRPGR